MPVSLKTILSWNYAASITQLSNKLLLFLMLASSGPEHQIPPWAYQCTGLDQQILTSWQVEANEKSRESYK